MRQHEGACPTATHAMLCRNERAFLRCINRGKHDSVCHYRSQNRNLHIFTLFSFARFDTVRRLSCEKTRFGGKRINLDRAVFRTAHAPSSLSRYVRNPHMEQGRPYFSQQKSQKPPGPSGGVAESFYWMPRSVKYSCFRWRLQLICLTPPQLLIAWDTGGS